MSTSAPCPDGDGSHTLGEQALDDIRADRDVDRPPVADAVHDTAGGPTVTEHHAQPQHPVDPGAARPCVGALQHAR